MTISTNPKYFICPKLFGAKEAESIAQQEALANPNIRFGVGPDSLNDLQQPAHQAAVAGVRRRLEAQRLNFAFRDSSMTPDMLPPKQNLSREDGIPRSPEVAGKPPTAKSDEFLPASLGEGVGVAAIHPSEPQQAEIMPLPGFGDEVGDEETPE